MSNGDLFTVAAIMGHDPKVADQSYLSVTDEMRSNAVFVGEALPDTYRTAKGLRHRHWSAHQLGAARTAFTATGHPRTARTASIS